MPSTARCRPEVRTFAAHEAKHALHGITVVVETDGDEIWIGRCDDVVAAGVVLKDADVHRATDGERPRADWLERAKLYGVHPRHRLATVPSARVVSVRRLVEL
jgi:hypothetical protein